jgi:hypothetical protein
MKELTGYTTSTSGEIRNGNPSRQWMDFTIEKFAYGCLPLIIANEMGWDILCQTSFKALWNGNPTKDSIIIQYYDEKNLMNNQAMSHFGHGVLTFHPNFLFKTESGHNLYVKGVPNLVKDAIQPLEGVVETDWLPLSFTMNWKFTRPNIWIEFEKGEPIARIMPYPRNYIETFNPTIRSLDSNEQVKMDLEHWSKDRREFIDGKGKDNRRMEKDYFKGVDKHGNKIVFHQKKIAIKDFKNNI